MGRDVTKKKKTEIEVPAGAAGGGGGRVGRPGRAPGARVRPRIIPGAGGVRTRPKGRRVRRVPA